MLSNLNSMRTVFVPDLALATDLYELTMAAAYYDNKETAEATFELFVRSYPKNRSYLVAAGLEQAVEYLSQLRFKEEHIAFLKKHPNFKNVSKEFFDYLKNFRFNGDVWAIPEGTVFFTDEPILRVTAPIIEAQIVETYLLSLMNFETLIATKATRVVQSARGKGVVEFGSRRAHGPEAAVLAARASYIGGCIGTSNVLAGYLLLAVYRRLWLWVFSVMSCNKDHVASVYCSISINVGYGVPSWIALIGSVGSGYDDLVRPINKSVSVNIIKFSGHLLYLYHF